MLRVLAWPDYALDETNRQFEQVSGIKVHCELFNQNEDAYQRLSQNPGGYDVVFADGHWPRRYLEDKLVQSLNPSDFRNWSGVTPTFREKCQGIWSAGEGRLAAYPGNWGLRGVIWDPRLVSTIDSWSDLWRLPPKSLWINSQGSEVIAETALSLGLPMNRVYDLSDSELAQVTEALFNLAPRVQGIWMTYADIAQAFRRSDTAVAEVDSTAIVSNLESSCGKDLKVVVPKEGTICWIDGAMIVSQTTVLDEAISFIDFLFSPEGTLLQWAHSEGYASTNANAIGMLLADSRYVSKVKRLVEDVDLVMNSTLYQAPRRIQAYRKTWGTVLNSLAS